MGELRTFQTVITGTRSDADTAVIGLYRQATDAGCEGQQSVIQPDHPNEGQYTVTVYATQPEAVDE